jgi:hypothetical protein
MSKHSRLLRDAQRRQAQALPAVNSISPTWAPVAVPVVVPSNLPPKVVTNYVNGEPVKVTSDPIAPKTSPSPTGRNVWIPHISFEAYTSAHESTYSALAYAKRLDAILQIGRDITPLLTIAQEQLNELTDNILAPHFQAEKIRLEKERAEATNKAMELLGITPEILALLQSMAPAKV